MAIYNDYDELGRMKTMTPEAGQVITYGYDPSLGRLTSIQQGTNTFAYAYDGISPLVQSLTRPNGSVTEYQYNDPLKRLTALLNKTSASEIISSYQYEYNQHDLKSREIIANGEPIDNFVARTTTYTPNNLNQLVSTTNPDRTYAYDDDGNMTTGYTTEGYALTMTYDAENRMKTAEYTDSNSIIHRTEYAYSGGSFLTEMKKFENGSLVSDTRYIRAGFLPVQERDENNLVTREYVWGQNFGGGISGLLNLRQGGSDYAYLYDGKGNVGALIDGSQAVVAAYAYDPFGVLMKKTALIDQPYMFSTKEYDQETGLSYYGYRFYNASIGKWTTRDPIGEAGGMSLYEFVENNPVNYIDPLGLLTEVITFSPVSIGRSSFGHTAININGVTYSFGEKGWFRENTVDFLKRNNKFRDAVGQVLDLTDEEEASLLKIINEDISKNPKWSPENSCVTKARDVLEQATYRMFRMPFQYTIISPLDFRDNLIRFGYVIRTNIYPRKK